MQLDDLWPAESKMGGDQSGAQLRWGKRQGPKKFNVCGPNFFPGFPTCVEKFGPKTQC